MTGTTLPRITKPLPQPPEGEFPADDVLTQAHHAFGYTVSRYEKTIAHEKWTTYNELIAAGIFPLEEEAVLRYKRRVVMMNWVKPAVAQAGFVVAIACVLAMAPTWLGSLLVGPMVVTTVVLSFMLWTRTSPGNWAWRRSSAATYPRPIPVSVLKTGIAVAKLFPNMQHHSWDMAPGLLVEEFSYRQRVADPFLILRFDHFQVYLAVWDEPTFKG